ncbi:hypothetical protein BD413DRAFT_561064 [Trametes elegans]|nr:hypothetical protein BD413DRAFT_561064 [Trametes elegans]
MNNAERCPSPFDLSHALGHNLSAQYGIPHDITSRLTLASLFVLKAQSALCHPRKPSMGSLDDDNLSLSASILRLGLQQVLHGSLFTDIVRPVNGIGLHSTLAMEICTRQWSCQSNIYVRTRCFCRRWLRCWRSCTHRSGCPALYRQALAFIESPASSDRGVSVVDVL